jgi:hypothetical protein
MNLITDAPHLAILCAVHAGTDDQYLVTGAVHGTQTNTTKPPTDTLTVQVLLDTGAVVDN